MLNVVLTLRVLGEGGATSDGVVREWSSAASVPDSRG